jgi:hypothetical protein
MDERTRRVGRNEAIFRAVNEQIETLNQNLAAVSDNTVHIVCECADLMCSEQLSVKVDEYERVRADSTLFFVLHGHQLPDLETVIEETGDYLVVCKHEGPPATMARETDTRTD